MKNKSGLALIELIVVIAIIGILVLISIPAYQNYLKKANDAACLFEMKNYAYLYVSERIAENPNISSLPLASSLKHCTFSTPNNLLADTLIATVPSGSGKIITCDVKEKVECEAN